MKKIYIILLFALAPFILKSQCFVQLQHTNELCNGDCNATANAFPVGQAPFTYMWTPGNLTTQNVTGLCAGNYVLVVVDATGCAATATFAVTQPTPVTVAMASVPASGSSACDGSAMAVATGGTPSYTYLWTPGGQTTATITNQCVGTYTCCVTDANNCQTCQTVQITFTTGIKDQASIGNLSLFPNPATNYINVKESFENSVSSEITIYDVLGKTLLTRTVSGKDINENFDLSSFTNGVYFISVKTEEGTSVQKFVKQ